LDTEPPTIKQWQAAKKRKVWFDSLNDDGLCAVIGIEIVSYNLDLLDEGRDFATGSLQTLYNQILVPKRFAAREHFKLVRRRLNAYKVPIDQSLPFSCLAQSIVKGIDRSEHLQEAVGRSVFAISLEDQISVIESILMVHHKFGLPAPLPELGVCNDWLEENAHKRLRIERLLMSAIKDDA